MTGDEGAGRAAAASAKGKARRQARPPSPGGTRGDRVEPRVPSNALLRWQREARAELDDIADAHTAVGGAGRARRVATVQINHAYAVMLSSQFQRFCRDLHTEAIGHMCAAVPTAWTRPILRRRLNESRKLDTGNPNPGNIGSDYGRLGIDVWSVMRARSARTSGRMLRLEQLNRWRNAIAHLDFADEAGSRPGRRSHRPVARGRAWLALRLRRAFRNDRRGAQRTPGRPCRSVPVVVS